MSSCGAIEFVRGGVIVEATISRSTFEQGKISSSTIDTSEVTNLTGIDNPSAAKIAEVMATLTEDELAALAKALAPLILPKISVQQPAKSEGEELPTAMIGKRDALLGEPEGWLKINDTIVPAYTSFF